MQARICFHDKRGNNSPHFLTKQGKIQWGLKESPGRSDSSCKTVLHPYPLGTDAFLTLEGTPLCFACASCVSAPSFLLETVQVISGFSFFRDLFLGKRTIKKTADLHIGMCVNGLFSVGYNCCFMDLWGR